MPTAYTFDKYKNKRYFTIKKRTLVPIFKKEIEPKLDSFK